jgi:hypothetical protein
MTDGQVSSAANMAAMVNRKANTRLCTLGIGRDANRNELVELANGGRGFCYMASDSKDITALITNMIANCCMYKYFTNVRINGKQVAEFGYPNKINTMFYKRESPTEELVITYEDPEFPGVEISTPLDVNVVDGDNGITQLYYANMEPKNTTAHLEHTILSKQNSFYLQSVDKITTEGALAKETVAHYSDEESTYLSLRSDEAQFMSFGGGSTTSYKSAPSDVLACMKSNLESVLQRGTVDTHAEIAGSMVNQSRRLGTLIGMELEEQSAMLDDLECCSTQSINKSNGYTVSAACGPPNGFGSMVRKGVRTAAASVSSLFTRSTPSASSKSMASTSPSANRDSSEEEEDAGFGMFDDVPTVHPATKTATNTVDILQFRSTDGSFRYSLELLALIGYTESEFQKYLAEHNVSQAKGLNQLVLEYLIKGKDSKFMLVILSLRQYLQKC